MGLINTDHRFRIINKSKDGATLKLPPFGLKLYTWKEFNETFVICPDNPHYCVLNEAGVKEAQNFNYDAFADALSEITIEVLAVRDKSGVTNINSICHGAAIAKSITEFSNKYNITPADVFTLIEKGINMLLHPEDTHSI
jgi:hypothetical protein